MQEIQKVPKNTIFPDKNYDNYLIQNLGQDEYYIKIAAWGNDDYGLEIVYDGYHSFSEASEKYDDLVPIFNSIPDGISKSWFINRGWKRF